MSEAEPIPTGNSVDRLPSQPRSMIVSDELNRLTTLLRESCPPEANITFHFNGRLYVHIDVRELQQVVAIELLLPTLGAGIFHDVQRGQAPRHAFLHRITALVDR